MKKKFKFKIKNPIRFISTLVSLVIVFMTLGFSAYQSAGLISASAAVSAQKDIRITGVVPSNPVHGAISNYESYTATSISATLQLPYANSKITYQVEVTNFGNIEMVLKALSGLPSNLKYTLTPSNYNLDDMICDDLDSTKCILAAKKTIDITIGYVDSSSYDSSNTTYPFTLDFTFAPFNKVAQIGNKYYSSLDAALKDVPTGTATTVRLLQNTSEATSLAKNKIATLDLGGNVLSNSDNAAVIANYGTLTITNGTVITDAATNGAINNETTGTITIDGIDVMVTGGRQALWNNKGTATITGGSHLTSSATDRAAVQNVSGGTMTVLDCTIKSTGTYGLHNLGTMTVGVKDGDIDKTTPVIISTVSNGLYTTTNMNFYNGIVKAKGSTPPFNDVNKITGREEGYNIVTSTETIDGDTYRTGYLGISKKVTFDPRSGTTNEPTRYVEAGTAVGELPTATRTGYAFDGWFTAATGGVQINQNTIINDAITFYAHWTQDANTARIGQTIYASLVEAVAAVPNNTQTTIELLRNTSEKIIISGSKRITLDLGGKTLSNNGTAPVIETSGHLTITNGTVKSTTTQGTINVPSGTLTIIDATISGTQRQAVYITGGSVEISGNSYLTSACSGMPPNGTLERSTVQVISGTLTVTGGTIVSTAQQAISNEGTTTIGVSGGGIDTTDPVIQGSIYGIKSTGTINFYDGILKGGTSAIFGTITNQEANTQPLSGTETIGGVPYNTLTLEVIP